MTLFWGHCRSENVLWSLRSDISVALWSFKKYKKICKIRGNFSVNCTNKQHKVNIHNYKIKIA